MKPARILLVLTLTLAACAQPGTVSTTSPGTTPRGDPATSASPTISDGEGVAVTVTATPVEQPDGTIELCPAGISGPCPGILLDGEMDPSLISSAQQVTVIEVQGLYDGRRLTPTAEPVVADYPFLEEPDFSSLCPELDGSSTLNPSDDLSSTLAEYTASQDDFAGMWWDQETSVRTVWFVGDDVSDHQAAIAGLSEDEPVCVAGGARFSEAELIEAAESIQGLTDSRGRPLVTAGYGIDTIRNQIPLSVEELDAPTRTALTEAVGDRVVIYPLLEMTEQTLADLPAPVPVVEGDVEILTSPIRSGGGMDALGTFEADFDPDLNCVYFPGSDGGPEGRTVPLWPFGYSATGDPLTVYDYDGNVVAAEGETLELGGGNVPADLVEGNRCGAANAWVVNQ